MNFNVNQILVPGYNQYTSATYPTSYTLSQTTGATVTGTGNRTTLASVSIPAGMLGANDTLRVTAYFSSTSSSNSKTGFVRLGTTDFGVVSWTGGAYQMQITIRARNSQTSQISNLTGPFGSGSQVLVVGVNDMTAAQTLTIDGQLGLSSETMTLLFYNVQVVRATVSSANVTYSQSQVIVPGINQYDTNNYGTTYSLSEGGGSVSATTTETVLGSVTIPANLLGPQDAMIVSYSIGSIPSANNKTYRIKFGGQTFGTQVVTTLDMVNQYFVIQNLTTSTQRSVNALQGATSVVSGTVNTASDQTLQITGQCASAAETITLYQYGVEIWRV